MARVYSADRAARIKELMGDDLSAAEIARRLEMPARTVRDYCQRIREQDPRKMADRILRRDMARIDEAGRRNRLGPHDLAAMKDLIGLLKELEREERKPARAPRAEKPGDDEPKPAPPPGILAEVAAELEREEGGAEAPPSDTSMPT